MSVANRSAADRRRSRLGALGLALGLIGFAIELLRSAAEPPLPFGPEEPGGNPLFQGWLGHPVHLAVVLVALGGAAAVIALQRGRRDRFEPLALVALAGSIVGISMTMGIEAWLATHTHTPVLGALRVAQVLLALSGLLGLAALARILARPRGERRGAAFALAAAGCSACALVAIHSLVGSPPPTAPGIELARLSHVQIAHPHDPEAHWPVATIDARGAIAVEGRALADDAALRDALREVAAAMPARDGFPDLPLCIEADGRAPFGAVVRFVAASTDARIWKLQYPCEREGSDLPAYRSGVLPLYMPKHAGAPDPERALRELRVLPEAHAYLLDGAPIDDATPPLVSEMRGSETPLVLAADPTLPWSRVAATFDAPEIERGAVMLAELRATPR